MLDGQVDREAKRDSVGDRIAREAKRDPVGDRIDRGDGKLRINKYSMLLMTRLKTRTRKTATRPKIKSHEIASHPAVLSDNFKSTASLI